MVSAKTTWVASGGVWAMKTDDVVEISTRQENVYEVDEFLKPRTRERKWPCAV